MITTGLIPRRRDADLPLPTKSPGESGASVDGPWHGVLALVPLRQVRERGFECHDDGEPILTMTVVRQRNIGLYATNLGRRVLIRVGV